jgi:pectinesterase
MINIFLVMRFFKAIILGLLFSISAKAQVFDFVVAKDGSGDFKTINEAINAVPDDKVRKTIFIKKGVYEEKVFIGNRWTEAPNKVISLIGENPDSVIITWSDYNGKTISYPGKTGTITADGMTCPTFTVTSPDFYMENITVRNPSTAAQAVALYQTADRQVLKNCKILGNQDTHRTKKGRRFFYYNSTIEGGVDFIYAGGTAYFYKCTISSVRDGYITAPEDITYTATLSTGKTLRYGFFFKDCDLVAGNSVSVGSVYLGRPWQKECGSVFLECRLGNHINANGWATMSGNESSACFAEYKSMNADGTALANVSGRVNWSMQLTTEDVNKYMLLSTIYNAVSTTAFDPVSMVIAPSPVSAVSLNGQELNWKLVEGAKGYIVYADGSALGFTKTGSFNDTVRHSTAPVYSVRTVGLLGNLSLPDGSTDNVTAAGINAALNTAINGIENVNASENDIFINAGSIIFNEETDCSLYNISGQKLLSGQKVTSLNVSRLAQGIYILKATDRYRVNYHVKFKI